MYWMYWKKNTGKCTGKHILFMACTGNVLGFFKIRPNIFYGYFGEPISPILPIFPIFPIFPLMFSQNSPMFPITLPGVHSVINLFF